MKHIPTFENFLNESSIFETLSKEEKVEAMKFLKEIVDEHKIDKVEITEIIYQYRYNDPQMRGKCFSGSKEIDDSESYEFFESLAQLLWKDIKKGGARNGSGDMSAENLVKLLPGIEIFMDGDKVEENSWLNVETGSDY